MRKNQIAPFCIAAVLLISCTCISLADQKREGKPRFKGVELYSWKGCENKWNFVIVDGTNRLKSITEIKRSKNRIIGVEPLKQAMAELAEGELVSWCHRVKGFEYPPKALRKEIAASAKKVKVELSISDRHE